MHKSAIEENPDDALLSLDDLAQLLGVAKRTLHHWRANGQLPDPDLVVGKTIRWWRSTITRWIRGMS